MSATERDAVPHGYPFRLVERAEAGAGGKVAVVMGTAGGMLTGAGPWPPTLVAEALAQAVLLVAAPADRSALRLLGLDGVRVFQPPSAGDRIEVEVAETTHYGSLRRYRCRALRGGGLVAVADVTVSS